MMKLSNEYELYHHGILGQKWGIRRFQNKDGTLTEEGRQRKLKKAEKLETKINKAAKREAVFTNMYLHAKSKADKYRNESKEHPTKNILQNIGRKYTQHMLNENVRDAKSYMKMGQNEVKKYMKKIGKDPDLQMAVLLGDVWGLPFDVYSVGLKDSKKVNDYNELNRVHKVFEEDTKNK